jgi:hypothetical protein
VLLAGSDFVWHEQIMPQAGRVAQFAQPVKVRRQRGTDGHGIGRAGTANITWTNTADGNWSVAANWSPHSVSGAKSRVQRGRAMLRKLLLECCQFEFDRRGGLAGCQPRRHTDCAECQ